MATRTVLRMAGSFAVAAVLLAGYLAWRQLGDGPGRGSDLSAADIERGASLYAEHCAACHGARLEGQPDWQSQSADGGYPAPPHDETGHTWHHADDVLFDYTKNGGQAFADAAFRSNMPGFAGLLDDSAIRAVLGFIKSTWPREVRERQARISGLNSDSSQ